MSTVTKAIILIYIIIVGVMIVVFPILVKLGMPNFFQPFAYLFIFIVGVVLAGFYWFGKIGIIKIGWFDTQEPESNREPEDWISMVIDEVLYHLFFGFWIILLILGWMWLLAMTIGWLELDWNTIVFVAIGCFFGSFTIFINLSLNFRERKKAAARKAPKVPFWAKTFIAIFVVVFYVATCVTMFSWI